MASLATTEGNNLETIGGPSSMVTGNDFIKQSTGGGGSDSTPPTNNTTHDVLPNIEN